MSEELDPIKFNKIKVIVLLKMKISLKNQYFCYYMFITRLLWVSAEYFNICQLFSSSREQNKSCKKYTD